MAAQCAFSVIAKDNRKMDGFNCCTTVRGITTVVRSTKELKYSSTIVLYEVLVEEMLRQNDRPKWPTGQV
jgi:hypothetical protein